MMLSIYICVVRTNYATSFWGWDVFHSQFLNPIISLLSFKSTMQQIQFYCDRIFKCAVSCQLRVHFPRNVSGKYDVHDSR